MNYKEFKKQMREVFCSSPRKEPREFVKEIISIYPTIDYLTFEEKKDIVAGILNDEKLNDMIYGTEDEAKTLISTLTDIPYSDIKLSKNITEPIEVMKDCLHEIEASEQNNFATFSISIVALFLTAASLSRMLEADKR